MTRLFLALVASLAVGSIAWAGESLEQEIEQAREQLDQAARQLAELHKQKYNMGDGEKKAMLGILLHQGSEKPGVALVGVTPGSGAQEAGLRSGDLIVEVGDVSLSDAEKPHRALSEFMQGVEPGDDVKVVYMRGDERRETNVATKARSAHIVAMLGTGLAGLEDLDIDLSGIDHEIEAALSHLPDVRKEIWMHAGGSRHGLMAVEGDLADYFDVSQGVIVLEPAAGSMLKAGDVILSIDGTDVGGVDGAARLLDAMEADAEVQVKRQGKRTIVVVKPDEFAALTDKTMTRVIRVKHPDQDQDEVVVQVEIVDD